MAMDFPSSPSNGQEFASGGNTYTYNGYGWAVKGTSADDYVNTTGDTMTGDLTISKVTPIVVYNDTGTAGTFFQSQRSTVPQWNVGMGNGVNGDFSLSRFDNGGIAVDTPFVINRLTGRVSLSTVIASTSPTTGALTVAGGLGVGGATTLGGDLTISKVSPALIFTKSASGETVTIQSFKGATQRWQVNIGNAAPESTGNLGSDFSIRNYDDTGTVMNIVPLSINRASGVVSMGSSTASTSPTTGALTIAGGVGVGGSLCVGSTVASLAGGSAPLTNGVHIIGANAGLAGISIRLNGAVWAAAFENSSGTVVGNISCTASATAYNTSSDARLKEDLKTFDAGNIIDDTEVYDFKWKETSERAYGVVAQQAKEVYDTPFSHDEKSDRHFVDYSKYVPVLLQELKALRARVAVLEGPAASRPAVRVKQGRK